MKRPSTNIGLYFHQLSKDISWGGRVQIPKEYKDYPRSWVDVEYKTYENVPKVKLLSKQETEMTSVLTDVIVSRKSSSKFSGTKKISLKELSTIINFSIALRKETGDYRVHPSGGGRYPLEYYFLIQNSEELKTGVYHYNVRDHSLEYIKEISKEEIPKITKKYEWVTNAAVVMFVTSIFDRNIRKYGERGYRYILLEAGHVGQNVYLANTALGLTVRAVAGTNDLKVEDIIGIDGVNESLVYSLVFG